MKPFAKRVLVWTVVLVVLGAIAAPKILPLVRTSAPAATAQGGARSGAAAGGSVAPLRVTAMTVTAVPFAETIAATGTLRAEESVELQAEVSGKIVGINFREGTRVRKGDLLVKINDADLRANLARATYRKQLAELKEGRLAALLRDGGAKQEDYDTAVNEVNVQKSEIELTLAQIAKTEIRAPFDGVIGLRFVSEGSFITATANATVRIATLQALDQLKVDFAIPEKYAGRVGSGAPLQFTVAGGDRTFDGEIYAIEPRIDIATRTVLIRAICPNPDGRLYPGAFANVELKVSQIENAVLIPAVAVVPGLTEKNVFVLQDGKAVRRAVQTGTRTTTSVHILSGLQPGDVVITSGIQQLRAGLIVSATMSNEVSPAAPTPGAASKIAHSPGGVSSAPASGH